MIPHINAPDCQSVTQDSKSNFLSSFRFLPQEKTQALIKVYAFFRIADDCVDELDEATDKQTALSYWENELIQMYKGSPSHPIMKELQVVVSKYDIPKEYFTGLLDGCRMDIQKCRYTSFDELYTYCYRVAGLVGLTCLKIFEYKSPSAEKMAIDLGLAFQLTNILRDVKGDLKLGRIYLAEEDLQQFGYSGHDLQQGVENQAFYNVMKYYSAKAEAYYQAAFVELNQDNENKLIAAKIMARCYHAILKKMIKKKFPVLRQKVSLNYFEKSRLLLPYLFK